MAWYDIFRRSAGTRHRRYRPSLQMGGGVLNAVTGLGVTGLDKTEAAQFTPTVIYSKTPLETIYIQSWAARNFVDIPIADMFLRWRVFLDDSENIVDAMVETERDHMVQDRLRSVMQAARIFGTGLLVIITRDAAMETPLNVERVRKGDLIALRVFDRFDASIPRLIDDIQSPFYGEPEFYDLQPATGGRLRVHPSRVIRFDGIAPSSDSRFEAYDRNWGVSELVPVLANVIQDAQLAAAVAHLSQEASIPVLAIDGLRDIMAGLQDPETPSLESIGQRIGEMKSNYRLFMRDKSTEDFERVSVTFTGMADLVDRSHIRLAAAAHIPKHTPVSYTHLTLPTILLV